jgi:hypothetical protein
MAVEIVIAGDECKLTLKVVRYEFSEAKDYHDANWLVTAAELVAGRLAHFEARCKVTIQAVELLDFRDGVRRAIESRSGSTKLDHMEEEVGCTIAIEGSTGELSAFLQEHVGAELSSSECRMDERQLKRTLRDLDAAVEAFPVRNRPA